MLIFSVFKLDDFYIIQKWGNFTFVKMVYNCCSVETFQKSSYTSHNAT